jgi:hypothetical protein
VCGGNVHSDTLGKQKSATEQLSEKNAPYAKANIAPCSPAWLLPITIEFTNGSEHMEVLKSHLCKQRNIKLVKLPFKTTETEAEYADRVKAVFKSVHIFIYSDVEVDVSVIKRRFDEWRKRL